MIERDFLYVGGEWIEPASGQTTEVIYPFTEEPIGRAALAGSADVDRAVRAARAAFDDGPWPRATAAERAAVLRRAGEQIEARADELAQLTTLEVGSADRRRRPPGRRGEALPGLARRPGGGVPVGGGAPWRLLEPARAPRAGRRRRRDRPLELPAGAHDAEALPRAAHRLHRRAQAGGGDAALRVPARRDLRAGGAPARRAERRSGRSQGERGARQAPAGRQDQLHRQHARGQPDRRDLR